MNETHRAPKRSESDFDRSKKRSLSHANKVITRLRSSIWCNAALNSIGPILIISHQSSSLMVITLGQLVIIWTMGSQYYLISNILPSFSKTAPSNIICKNYLLSASTEQTRISFKISWHLFCSLFNFRQNNLFDIFKILKIVMKVLIKWQLVSIF